MEIDMEPCPVTGLPIVQKPHWTNIRITDKYSVTFQMIGDRILHLLPRGNSATIDVDKLYYHREQVLKECSSPRIKIVEIKNCKDIFGSPPLAARKAFIRHYEEEAAGCLGVLTYNAPWFTRTILRVASSSEITSFGCRPCCLMGKTISPIALYASYGRTWRSLSTLACVDTSCAGIGRSMFHGGTLHV